jgi:Na+/H+-dicarboxylate symporter
MLKLWFRIPFWQRVLGGFVLGGLVGWLLGPAAATWLQPLGTLYVNLIKMIATPLVFFAVINAVASLHGQRSIAGLAGRTFAWFVVTALLAVGIGLAVAWSTTTRRERCPVLPRCCSTWCPPIRSRRWLKDASCR